MKMNISSGLTMLNFRKYIFSVANFLRFLNQVNIKGFIVVLFFVIIKLNVFSQTIDLKADSILSISETDDKSIVLDSNRLTEFEKSRAFYLRNKHIRIQKRLFNELETKIQNAGVIIKQGVDYAGITKEINLEADLRNSVMKGIAEKDSGYLTVRNLVTTTILLKEILNRTEKHLVKIKESNRLISNVQNSIDSISAEKSIFFVPDDSLQKAIYFKRYHQINENIIKIGTQFKHVLDSIQHLEILCNDLKYDLQNDINETTRLQKIKYKEIFTAGENVFTTGNNQENLFLKTLIHSFVKGFLLLVFYFYNHWVSLIIMLAFILTITIYLKVLKYRYIKAGIYKEFKRPVQILVRPVATASLICITMYQFFLPMPPFILTGLLWIFAGIALTRILYNTEKKFVYKTWILFFGLNLLAIFDNIIVIHTYTEAWLILILTITAMLFGIYVLINGEKLENKPKQWIFYGMVILEMLALVFILAGNYNTGKILMTEGIFTILVGYLLINTFRFLRSIFVFSEFLKESDEEKKLEVLSNKPAKISVVSFTFFLTGWLFLISRNSYGFQKFIEPISAAFSVEREIGEFTFTYQGFFVFVLVLFLSVFISKVVSFLANDNRFRTSGEKKSGIGSWLLLIRIGIITTGIIIAFRSAGLPMDRLTMIISALGVGLAFGMQTLVNNLISGVFIAFEKPINLDDIVEIGGQTGKMKSIGIRSSVITTYDGSDVIIPNGDLLNQHLVNWTLGSTRRRYEIQVGVAYGTDLNSVKKLLFEILSNHKMVLKNPGPIIWATTFNESSIDFVVKYWVSHFNYGNDVKSDLIISIDEEFKRNNIVIPFPQRDIHIQSESQVLKNSEAPETETKSSE